MTFYYRTCDKCGHVTTHYAGDTTTYACRKCGSAAAWEFPLLAKALDMARQVEAHAAEDAARLREGRACLARAGIVV